MPRKLILVIEDNEKNMKLVRDLLQYEGYEFLGTDTAEEGLRLAGENLPALILMDIGLPGMSGFEALKHLRAAPATAGIPVIAVTASVMTQDHQKITEAGFDGYQRKPIDIDEFLEAVRSTLEHGGKRSAE
ncbi:MAG: response regulator [Nitrospirae bacterium]|nr:MAG: response regulator [Nitrospirota bacterium]